MRRDRDRLRDAFSELRACGWWAYANSDTGLDAVPDDVLKRDGKFVVWHAHETAIAFNEQGDLVKPLHLHHKHRDAEELARLLVQYDLHPRIDGPSGEPSVILDPRVCDAG